MERTYPADRPVRLRAQVAVFGIFFLTPLLYALYTNHAWEDWFIAYRSCINLVEGHGLVYHIGDRLYTYSSPIGVLVPAILTWLSGKAPEDVVLWLYRFVTCTAFGFTGVWAYRTGTRLLHRPHYVWLLLVLLLLDVKMIDYTINGMETAFMLFFLTAALYVVSSNTRRPLLWLSLCVGGLCWTRPDWIMYAGGWMLGLLIWVPRTPFAQRRADWFWLLLKAGVLGALMYLPWLAWATWYYGSPIPHTVVAKGLGSTVDVVTLVKKALLFPYYAFTDPTMRLYWTYAPSYPQMGGWPSVVMLVSKVVAGLACFGWLLPRVPAWGRVISLGALVGVMYLSLIKDSYPWYVPMTSLTCSYALVLMLDGWFGRQPVTTFWRWTARLGTATFVVYLLSVFGAMAYEMKLQQEVIEDNNRRQIGLFLRANAQPGETAFAECLGYVGYFSGLKMYDYPGLASVEVVDLRRRLTGITYPFIYPELIARLKPDWVVLRGYETWATRTRSNILDTEYQQARLFDVTPILAQHRFLPGRPYLEWDATYFVFRRVKKGQTPAAGTPAAGVPAATLPATSVQAVNHQTL